MSFNSCNQRNFFVGDRILASSFALWSVHPVPLNAVQARVDPRSRCPV